MRQKLMSAIEAYVPVNEQEAADQAVILQQLRTNDNIFERSSRTAHMTASAWVVNQEHDKVLMVYHNLYHSWSWLGGHADGEENLLAVAIREVQEESGITDVRPVTEDIYSLEVLTVDGHEKHEEYVSSHLHLNLTYLLEADETAALRIKEDENSAVAWFGIEECIGKSSEPWFQERIYSKLNAKLKTGCYRELAACEAAASKAAASKAATSKAATSKAAISPDISAPVNEGKSQKGKTLYVSDLDGTLLNREERISPRSRAIINELTEQGMLFTYATARSLVSASRVTGGLSAGIPVIAYNGAFILRPDTGEVLAREGFTVPQMEEVREQLEKHGICPLVYALIDGAEKVSWIPAEENEGVRRYLSLRKGDERLRPVESKTELYRGDMFYFTCIGEKEELLPIYQIFGKQAGYHCTLQQELYRPEYWCEIMPASATKARAVRKLKELWKCDRVVSFGDAINDLPLFEASDEAYAVANAVPELKAAADGVIASNEEDGVALWLKEHWHP